MGLKIITILFVICLSSSNCLPTDHAGAITEIKANISSLWTELSTLKNALKKHVGTMAGDSGDSQDSSNQQFYQRVHQVEVSVGNHDHLDHHDHHDHLDHHDHHDHLDHHDDLDQQASEQNGTDDVVDPADLSQRSEEQHYHHHYHHHHNFPGHFQRCMHEVKEEPYEAHCELTSNVEEPTSTLNGLIIITQDRRNGGALRFALYLKGFPQTGQKQKHGFHVHQNSITGDACSTGGGHFNPFGVNHGSPQSQTRHVGDLGNIEVDEFGKLVNHVIYDTFVQFHGETSIIGKSIVIHAMEDDLGLGGDAGSMATGNAGKRLACCTIVPRYNFDLPHSTRRIRFNG